MAATGGMGDIMGRLGMVRTTEAGWLAETTTVPSPKRMRRISAWIARRAAFETARRVVTSQREGTTPPALPDAREGNEPRAVSL